MNILVTGGASGLGEAITRALAQNPQHTVYFTYFNSEAKARDLEKELPNTRALRCDFTDQNSLTALKAEMANLDLDVLVNNAVTGLTKKHFHKMEPDLFLESFRHNVLPAIHITQAAINIFRKKKFGKIITILSSYILNKPPVGLSEYVAAKEYLHALSKAWAAENASFNITSNCISPALMQTNLTADTDERILEEMQKSHPLKKLLTPQEVAEAVNFVVSSSQHLNGANLVINAAADLI